ncbi:MAG: ribosome maturation factor RimM [Kocuria sp.]|nr:ribosome maturation factor RimM [Kocuria sp.]
MRVKVARIGKPHGIRGEVTVQLFTDEPQLRFAPGSRLSVETATPAGAAVVKGHELEVSGARWNKQVLVVGFNQVTDRNAAEALRGSQLFVEEDSSGMDDDTWYEHDLIEMDVVVADWQPQRVGRVTGLRTMPHQDLLQVTLDEDGREIDIPFVQAIVSEINEEDRTVVLTPPPGLLELGADGSDKQEGAPDAS